MGEYWMARAGPAVLDQFGFTEWHITADPPGSGRRITVALCGERCTVFWAVTNTPEANRRFLKYDYDRHWCMECLHELSCRETEE